MPLKHLSLFSFSQGFAPAKAPPPGRLQPRNAQRRGCQREAAGKCKARFSTLGHPERQLPEPPTTKPTAPRANSSGNLLQGGNCMEQELCVPPLPPLPHAPSPHCLEMTAMLLLPSRIKASSKSQHQPSPCTGSQEMEKSSSDRESTGQASGRGREGQTMFLGSHPILLGHLPQLP